MPVCTWRSCTPGPIAPASDSSSCPEYSALRKDHRRMSRLPWLVLAALMVAAPAGRADDTHPGLTALSAGIQRTTLKNGLRLVLAPDSKAAAVDVAVWYDAGSRHD